MIEIQALVKDAFEVISLILVFAFVLFDIRYPQIVKQLEKDFPPTDRVKDRELYARDLRQTILLGSLPLVIIYCLLIFLFTPTLISVLKDTNFQLLQFDFVLTAFVLVYFFILVFAIWSLYLAFRLVYRWREVTGSNR